MKTQKNYPRIVRAPEDLGGKSVVNWAVRRLGVHPLAEEPEILHLLPDKAAVHAVLTTRWPLSSSLAIINASRPSPIQTPLLSFFFVFFLSLLLSPAMISLQMRIAYINIICKKNGFIASHVANRLIRNYPDYKIVVLDKLDYCSTLKNLDPSRPSPNLKFVKGDIASADLVNYLLITENIDTIMHFAAQTHVDNSFGNSFEFTKNNIYGTHVLLEACKVTGGITRFIHVKTDEVYGETDEDAVVGNHEASQLLPTNPYSATKAGAEMLVMAYSRSYGLPVITTRGNNVYGPNQFPEKLIPKLILLAMRGKQLPIHGDGSNVRSYLYCEDVAEAFECILHKGEVGHVYNIGTKKERRVIDVAKDVCALFSLDPDRVIRFVEDRPFNDQRYFLDDQKLKNQLNLCFTECISLLINARHLLFVSFQNFT
ncbi:hypothetical protein LUZ60_008414 [Juncus effusus]|nr:hypothetical protein LUZ60_008414 [Juncus effusus]